MGAYGFAWRVAVPPDGWCRWTRGWGVIGQDGNGGEVVFQPDRLGRVWGYAGSVAVRHAHPRLGETIRAASRAAVIQDLPRPYSRYGHKGSDLRRQLCQAIADRLNAVGPRPGLLVGFLLSDAQAAAMRAGAEGGL